MSLFAVFVQQRGELLLVLQKIAASMSCFNKIENREEKRRKDSWFMLLSWEEKPEKEQESFLLQEKTKERRRKERRDAGFSFLFLELLFAVRDERTWKN